MENRWRDWSTGIAFVFFFFFFFTFFTVFFIFFLFIYFFFFFYLWWIEEGAVQHRGQSTWRLIFFVTCDSGRAHLWAGCPPARSLNQDATRNLREEGGKCLGSGIFWKASLEESDHWGSSARSPRLQFPTGVMPCTCQGQGATRLRESRLTSTLAFLQVLNSCVLCVYVVLSIVPSAKKKKKECICRNKKNGSCLLGLLFCSWGDKRFQETTYVENPLDRRAWQAHVHRVTRVRHGLVTKPPPLPYTHQERAEGREPPHEPTAKMVLSPGPIQVYHSQPPACISPGLERRRGLRWKRGREEGGERLFFPWFSSVDLTLLRLTIPLLSKRRHLTLTQTHVFPFFKKRQKRKKRNDNSGFCEVTAAFISVWYLWNHVASFKPL